MSMNTSFEGQFFSEAIDPINAYPLPFVSQNTFPWAEHHCRAGNIHAVVGFYKNIPYYLQNDLNLLVSDTYRDNLMTLPFLEASLLLLKSGVLSKFRTLNERLKHFCPSNCPEFEQQKAIQFVTDRKPNDIVVMVLRSDRLIATMTLFPINTIRDIPSLSYLEIGSAVARLPDVPSLEVGRLATINCNGYYPNDPEKSFIDMASMAAAFLVSNIYVIQNGLLGHSKSFICGDTHGSLITSLKRFFPLTVYDSQINPGMLQNDSAVRGMSSHFIQRQVLGSFKNASDLLAAIQRVADRDRNLAYRIETLLDLGLNQLGVSSIHQFDPKRFRVHFFQFPYNHPKTISGLDRMDRMMRWVTSRPRRSKRILN